MFFRQYELGCLSLFSYLIGDETTGRAVVVDPQRDISQYLGDAEAAGLEIERVIETHFHADFLSGHLEMAAATGAAVSYGEAAKTEFAMEPLADGQRLSLGEVALEILATPGHTPESISVVVSERDGEPWGVLTGDTLFIGDVGRPDLLSSNPGGSGVSPGVGVSADDLARALYRSLHTRLLALPDGVRVFPAHGAGSACGKNLSTATQSTIGEQRATNYALQPMSEDDFVAAVTTGQAVAPPYFGFAARTNRSDHHLLDDLEAPPVLDVDEVERRLADGAVLIDGRPPAEFASGHLRGAINVGMEGRFAEYCGDIAQPDQPIILCTDPGREGEAKIRLARIGFDRVIGAVGDVPRVLAEHPEVAVPALRISALDFAGWDESDGPVQLIDVRNPGEQEGGVIAGARRIPLAALLGRLDELDPTMTTIVYCAGGYRSIIAASALTARGFPLAADILGGYDAWKAAGFPTEAPAPSSAS
jgi:hydroxyacylglutathione hydrolase